MTVTTDPVLNVLDASADEIEKLLQRLRSYIADARNGNKLDADEHSKAAADHNTQQAIGYLDSIQRVCIRDIPASYKNFVHYAYAKGREGQTAKIDHPGQIN